MAFDFPSPATPGQTFTPIVGGPTYTFNGTAWNLSLSGSPGPGYLATSTTSVPLQTGPVTVTTQTALAYQVGARARLSLDANDWMEGPVTAYSTTTGSLSLNVDLTSGMVASAVAAVPGALSGLTLSNDATTPTTVLDIAAGGACSDDGTSMMVLTGPFIKNCNAAWGPGSGSSSSNGALDSGSALGATTWYHVYLIQNPATLAVDILLSGSATSPSLPTNYTKKRRIGSILTNASSQILAFTQVGDEFLWTTQITNYSGFSFSAAAAPLNVSAPLGVRTVAIVTAAIAPTGTMIIYLWAPDTNTPVGGATYTMWCLSGQAMAAPLLRIRTNTLSQITMAANAAGNGFSLTTQGWVDTRGK